MKMEMEIVSINGVKMIKVGDWLFQAEITPRNNLLVIVHSPTHPEYQVDISVDREMQVSHMNIFGCIK